MDATFSVGLSRILKHVLYKASANRWTAIPSSTKTWSGVQSRHIRASQGRHSLMSLCRRAPRHPSCKHKEGETLLQYYMDINPLMLGKTPNANGSCSDMYSRAVLPTAEEALSLVQRWQACSGRRMGPGDFLVWRWRYYRFAGLTRCVCCAALTIIT